MLFCVLGPLAIRVDGGRVVEVPARKPRAVLSNLLLHADTWVGVDQLIDRVWGERPPASARRNVKTYVWQLRRLLAECGDDPNRIEHGTGGYRIAIGPEELDTTVFERLAVAGRDAARSGSPEVAVERWRTALALWRGSPFGDIESEVAGPEAQRLIELRQGVRAELAEAQLELGDVTSSVATLRAMTEEQPLRESAWCRLIRALDRMGARAEALTAYRRASEVLRAELGVEPSAELRGLYESLRTGPPTGRTRGGPADFLPRDLADFTGRAPELTSLLGAGGDHDGPVVEAVDGMAGIGKTALVVRVARMRAAEYPDARLFIDLHGHSAACPPVDPASALDSLLRMLGVPGDRIPAGLEQKAALWRAELAPLRAIVVLDNAADSAQVRPLLPSGRHCLVLITSRRQLGGLDGVRTRTLDVLRADESAALFAGSLGDGRALAEPDAVRSAVELCGHLPLAIRIAAARLRHRSGWSVGDLADRLRRGHDRLTELTAGDRSVASAFELSYRLLPAPQRRMFRLLGLVPGPDIDRYAAAALAGRPLPVADALLEDLVDANLVGEPAAGRYRCHDLMRAEAARLAAAEEPPDRRHSAVTRLLDYYLHTLARCADLLEPHRRAGDADVTAVPAVTPPIGTLGDALRWVEAERETLTAVVAHAAARRWSTHAWQLAHGLWRFLCRWDAIGEGTSLIAAPLAAVREAGDRRGEAALLTDLGVLRSHSHQFAEGFDDLRHAVDLHRELGDRHSEAVTLANLGYLNGRLGRHVLALDQLYEAIAIATELGNRETEARLRNDVATYLEEMGRYAESLRNTEQALAIHLDAGNPHGEAMSRQTIGKVYRRLGHADQAATQFALAYELYLRTGDRFDAAETLNALADVCHALGRPDEAVRHHREAAGILRQITDRGADSPLLNELGDAYQGAGQYAHAVASYSEALALAVTARDRTQVERARDGLAACLDPA